MSNHYDGIVGTIAMPHSLSVVPNDVEHCIHLG